MRICQCGTVLTRTRGPKNYLCDTCRFWSYVDTTGDCWSWAGAKTGSGYGAFWLGRLVLAHRHAYALLMGNCPPYLDHLCRNTLCVNPDHLDGVSMRENTMRGHGPSRHNAEKTHCLNGHEFTLANTYTDRRGRRHCRTCNCRRQREYQARHHSPSSFSRASR